MNQVDSPPVRRHRRWFQLSLRTLLLAITILAIGPGGWVVLQRRQMEREALALGRLKMIGTEVYARHSWLWTFAVGRSAGPVVGLVPRNTQPGDRQLLSAFTQLIWLDLTDQDVTDDDLKSLVALHKLERLRLDETLVTNAGVAHLVGLPQLHTLNLQRTAVDDDCLEQLARMPNLKELFLQKTNVTDAGILKLRNLRPNLKIAGGRDLPCVRTLLHCHRFAAID